MSRKSDNYGLSPDYAAECNEVLNFLEPEGVVLGLREKCKAARAEILRLRKILSEAQEIQKQ